ncbi:MAG: type II secretion system secretin GspD [Parvularculaceae bacterium]|nr:type II secretion system secretin GspD [Parvularculaceae bacterium]
MGAAVLQLGMASAQEGCGEALNLEDADIRSVVDEIAIRTGKKFVLDPRVQGRVSIKSGPNGGLCADEAWELFQAALRVTGFTAAPINGDSYRIIPVQEGARAAGPVGDGEPGNFVTQIVRLNHIDSREAAANLAQLVSERGVVAPVRSGNAVILVDAIDNVERLQRVLAQLDRDTTVYRTIPLENASASEVARVLTNLAREISEEGAPGASSVSVVPVSGSNSILVRAEPVILSRLVGVVAELDRIGQAKSDLSVITLNHADAEEMSTLLKDLANAQTTAPAAAGAESPPSGQSRANISFHKATNSVIISGDADIQQTLRKVVQQLDVRRAQVQIEAIIVEVSDTTAKALGVEYFLAPLDGKQVPFTATNFSGVTPNILAAAGALLLDPGLLGGDDSDTAGDDDTDSTGNNSTLSNTLANTAVTSLLGTNGFIGGAGGRIGDDAVFGAIVTALKRDTESNVLSFPSVVTLDNEEAKLSVGQEIPITTGEAVGDNFQNAFRTVSREQVGIILEVTPQINEGGTVTMKIRQETSSVAGQIINTSTDLITNKREIETTAIIDDGGILVIGGLIDQTDSLSQDKVPLLGDIPLAGNLFRTTSRSRDRRNLMVFLRPTIIRDRASGESVTQKKFDYIKARELLSSGRPQSELERLIDQVTGGSTPERPELVPLPATDIAPEPLN